jgi:hypothetical protein
MLSKDSLGGYVSKFIELFLAMLCHANYANYSLNVMNHTN